MSEDGTSVANSDGSETTAGGSRRRRRSIRTSTAFHLAHPAPTLTQKQRLLQIRPRLLLQLQRLSTESRPKPAIDVLPSTVVVPRLMKRFPRMFRGKSALGANDVMVVKSEEYDTSENHVVEDTDSDEESLANRDLMAVICQAGKSCGKAQGLVEIVLRDGSVWVAAPLPNGFYEFSTVDERGNKITARWVKRSIRRSNLDPPNEFKFTFSIIDPNSRRHPILASLTNNTLDIPDTYISVSSSASKYPPTSPLRGLPDNPQISVEEPNVERTTHFIDENMKSLIQVTGIWVALRQGLSPYFKYDDAVAADSSPVQRNVAVGHRVRSLSVTTDAGRVSPAGTVSSTPDSAQSIFGGRMRQKCVKGSPSSNVSPQDCLGNPKRSVSTGSAFMQRAAARRAGILPSTVVSDSEGESMLVAPKRASTVGGSGTRDSTPHHRSLPGSSTTPLDTPTRPQRRTQSVYLPPTLQQKEVDGNTARHIAEIMDGSQTTDLGEKTKTSRWKALKDFFRRSNSASRSG
ncbi:hypothetical protein D0Z07_4685 [Hyphodiscus hymeniophilus]|uniref:Uncharacterized protein n=1 Tax=Hyphodiscus hymeniophilus TaxID=353542 RepID=A0A9P6VIY9_9HELO|nr:hypothetical protein D0Z07_4685 [Hyphodiscus hymeniophilus]